ncbi:hypothetical protein IFM89_009713 [Coptis chinensis]|uniref:Nop domain-containing protein n=1 Tax=Coptis chinensis TaxID=261450 RepID=A0A835LIS8_9MAGN|nr:hypothetical protein IFM89_009713 [Coptis chinensis]
MRLLLSTILSWATTDCNFPSSNLWTSTFNNYYGCFVQRSTTSGNLLPKENLKKTLDACDRALALDLAKKKVLDFVESRMSYNFPNLSTIIGSVVAAKLMGTAGGLSAFAKILACNVQLLGVKKKTLAGFSIASSHMHVGFLEQKEIFHSKPPLRMCACRLLAVKSTLATRVNSIRGEPMGRNGRTLRDAILKKNSEPKQRRGGRSLRKMKERYVVTNMRMLANMMQFGIPEESSLNDGLREGYGMLDQAVSGKLQVSIGQGRLAEKVANKFKEQCLTYCMFVCASTTRLSQHL